MVARVSKMVVGCSSWGLLSPSIPFGLKSSFPGLAQRRMFQSGGEFAFLFAIKS